MPLPTLWMRYRSSERLTLTEQLDYQGKLSKQFPFAGHRVVYSASGQYLAASRISRAGVVIDKSLYWASCDSASEAMFLEAILNSQAVTKAVEPFQSRGEHHPRHFDKIVFQLPIPTYDASDPRHAALVDLAGRAETLIGALTLVKSRRFEAMRRDCREALESVGLLALIDALTVELLALK